MRLKEQLKDLGDIGILVKYPIDIREELDKVRILSNMSINSQLSKNGK